MRQSVPLGMDAQVLIVGAGPTGLTLAIDLGRRGVRALVIEQKDAPQFLPKMERCNARTMEIYRRMGIAKQVRAAGLPAHCPMDIFVVLSLVEPPLVHHVHPSVAEAKALIATSQDGGQPLEPYQLISQYTLEPLLKGIAETLPTITLRYGCELVSFEQDENCVTAQVKCSDGSSIALRAPYMVGCDGGGSLVRRQLGIKLDGEANIQELRQALYYCEDLYERIPIGKGRHYHVADAEGSFLIVQDSTRHFTLHSVVETDSEMAGMFERVVAMPVKYEMLYVGQWRMNLLLADRYGEGRVFLAGDAVHLVIPTGGLGMNTGVGDAIDLSWKLAATLAGWGGPKLLAAYEIERRQVGARNVAASGFATQGRRRWRALYRPEIRQPTAAGAEPGEGPKHDFMTYVATTWPGARLPHVWLDDGSAMQDRIGYGHGYTLLRLGGTKADTSALRRAFAAVGAMLQVLDIADERPRDVYGHDLLLLRPDMHVVWRGNDAPAEPATLAAMATGH